MILSFPLRFPVVKYLDLPELYLSTYALRLSDLATARQKVGGLLEIKILVMSDQGRGLLFQAHPGHARLENATKLT